MEEVEKYDHSKESFSEAIGLSKERIEDMKSLCFSFSEEGGCLSEVAEKLDKSFTRRELVFLATIFITETYEKVREIEKLFRSKL
jgi:hypothetical protein